MKPAAVTASVLLAAAPALLDAHGIFVTPVSRAVLSEQSGYMTDATSIISEPMPDVAQGRDYPGARPFAEPGMSISNVGPCGMETYDELKTNWNHPEHSWGSVQATYQAGDIIDVEWCVSDIADHGGIYSYRICQDDSIVAKFIDENYTPNQDDMTAMEDCFQAGILKCSDVPGQDCAVHPDCVNTGWGCEAASSEWFNCGPKDNGRCMSKQNAGKCQTHGDQGSIIRDQVKLPAHKSNHTLIGFRWDCEDTPQLWLHCADIALV